MTSEEPKRTLSDHLARRRRAAIAGHDGDATSSRRLLDDEDPTVRATALGALARSGAIEGTDLVAGAGDPSVIVRRRTAEVLGIEAVATLPVSLAPLLADADPSVIEMAAWAAGERHHEQRAAGVDSVDEIVTRLAQLAAGHDDALVREAAVAALGSIGAPDGLPIILGALDDKITIRRRAVIALAPFEGPEVEAALRKAATDRDWQVRQTAEDLVAEPPAGD
jgi:HEAT repeat protein